MSDERCDQPAAPFIPRWGMAWACALPKGHEGQHQRGGTCIKHGEYVGERCPQWPDCAPPDYEAWERIRNAAAPGLKRHLDSLRKKP